MKIFENQYLYSKFSKCAHVENHSYKYFLKLYNFHDSNYCFINFYWNFLKMHSHANLKWNMQPEKSYLAWRIECNSCDIKGERGGGKILKGFAQIVNTESISCIMDRSFFKTLLLKLLFTVAIKLLSGISREYSKFRGCFSLLSSTSAFICINMSTFRVSVSYVSSWKTFAIPIDLRYRCFSVFSLHIILCITLQCLIERLDVHQPINFSPGGLQKNLLDQVRI